MNEKWWMMHEQWMGDEQINDEEKMANKRMDGQRTINWRTE